jgi:cysteinyl-tRNA synthetase
VVGFGAQAAQLRQAAEARGGTATPLDLGQGRASFAAAMADDLNTPLALSTLSAMAGETIAAAAEGREVEAAAATIRELATMLGFTLVA